MLIAVNRSPSRRSMTTLQELVVLSRVTLGTVLGRQMLRNRKTAMLKRFLAFGRPVTIKTIHVRFCMLTALELVNDSRGLPRVALRALARSTNQRGRRPQRITDRSLGVDHQCRHDHRRTNENGNEYRLESHGLCFQLSY